MTVLARPMLLSKLHRLRVTAGDPNYVGSITLDSDLTSAADLLPGQQVDVLDVTNGARLTTYVIEAPAGSGRVEINGAAAQLVRAGDIVIVVAYGMVAEQGAADHQPIVVFVDQSNRPTMGDPKLAETLPTNADQTSKG